MNHEQEALLWEWRQRIEILLYEIATNTRPAAPAPVAVPARGSLFETMVGVIDRVAEVRDRDLETSKFKVLVSLAALDRFKADPPTGFNTIAGRGIPIFSVASSLLGTWRSIEIHLDDSIAPEFFRLVPR